MKRFIIIASMLAIGICFYLFQDAQAAVMSCVPAPVKSGLRYVQETIAEFGQLIRSDVQEMRNELR